MTETPATNILAENQIKGVYVGDSPEWFEKFGKIIKVQVTGKTKFKNFTLGPKIIKW